MVYKDKTNMHGLCVYLSFFDNIVSKTMTDIVYSI